MQTQDSKEEETGTTWFPADIVYVPGRGGKRGHHIDPTTGEQTYPSSYKRSVPRRIYPEDIGRSRREPRKDDKELLRLLNNQVHIDGLDWEEGIPTRKVIKAIRTFRKVKISEARELLYGLWDCGLVWLEGKIHGASKRPFHQRWHI